MWIPVSVLAALPVLLFYGFIVPTPSMENSVLRGDHILIPRISNYTPHRGDIVAFYFPVDRRQRYLHRIMGMPGDHIRIAAKAVFLNGAPLTEPYATHITDYVEPYRDTFPAQPNNQFAMPPAKLMLTTNVSNGEIVVPEGKYFVLGDNRDNSLDSRYWGFIEREDMIGKPAFILASTVLDLQDPINGRIHGIRWDRFFKRL